MVSIYAIFFLLYSLFFILYNKYKIKKSLLNHIIINNPDVYKDKLCPICLEDFIEDKSNKICVLEVCLNNKHPFHKKCILKYLYNNNSRCPVCRASIIDENMNMNMNMNENHIRISII